MEKGRKKRKDAANAASLCHILAEIKGGGLRAMRDRTLLALSMAAALRRSELVALTMDTTGIFECGMEYRLGAIKIEKAERSHSLRRLAHPPRGAAA